MKRRRGRPARQAVRRPQGGMPARRGPGRRLILALLLMTTLGSGGAAWWFWSGSWQGGGERPVLASLARLEKTVAFPFRQIKVVGPMRRVSPARVRDIVAPFAARGFFATDVSAIRRALRALPWVDTVTVRRVWPDLLQITLVEQEAVARWGAHALLNARGEVFTPAPEVLSRPPLSRLPLLQGPSGSAPQMLARYRAMRARLEPLGLGLATLTLEQRRSWWARLDNGITLALGKTAPEQRLARFARYYPRLMEGARQAGGEGAGRLIEAVDLRYANGFVVRWRKDHETARTGLWDQRQETT